MNNTPVEKDELYSQISQLIEQGRQQIQRSVNSAMVSTYWQIGRLIVEDEQQGKRRAGYGQQQLTHLARKLTEAFGKGFDISNLRNMRRFYLAFPIQETLSLELSWSHYNVLARIESNNARQWYMHEAASQHWSVRALERQIGVLYYERLLSSKERAPLETEAKRNTQPLADSPKDYLRDPYILDFLNLRSGDYQEADLERGIIDNLQRFLLELGKGFAFVERQQRIHTDDGDYFIDLVFYNFHLKCFLLIDLKMHKLSHQDVGQMDMYVRLYEEKTRRPDDNPTIGLILCSDNNHTVAKYSVLNESQHLFVSKYVTELPTEEELRREVERERERVKGRIEEAKAGYWVSGQSKELGYAA